VGAARPATGTNLLFDKEIYMRLTMAMGLAYEESLILEFVD